MTLVKCIIFHQHFLRYIFIDKKKITNLKVLVDCKQNGIALINNPCQFLQGKLNLKYVEKKNNQQIQDGTNLFILYFVYIPIWKLVLSNLLNYLNEIEKKIYFSTIIKVLYYSKITRFKILKDTISCKDVKYH